MPIAMFSALVIGFPTQMPENTLLVMHQNSSCLSCATISDLSAMLLCKQVVMALIIVPWLMR